MVSFGVRIKLGHINKLARTLEEYKEVFLWNPYLTIQYGEFAVADYLSKRIKDASVFILASAQEKGIDLLLYRHNHG